MKYYFFQLHRETAHYHKRSNAETVFSMIKGSSGKKLKKKPKGTNQRIAL